MEVIGGEWYMQGIDPASPDCIHSADRLLQYIEQVGFLPLFANEIDGFSVENMTDPASWWGGDADKDPWEWRGVIARTGKAAYGKFFGNKAGFVSREWFPHFANYRRDGYDFDSRYDDGKADRRQKLVMDLFWPEEGEIWETEDKISLYSNEIKTLAGFGKGGQRGFESTISKLQMSSYLTVRDFRPRLNKKGEEYGWAVAVYTLPEYLWGYRYVTGCYGYEPKESYERIRKHICSSFNCSIEAASKLI